MQRRMRGAPRSAARSGAIKASRSAFTSKKSTARGARFPLLVQRRPERRARRRASAGAGRATDSGPSGAAASRRKTRPTSNTRMRGDLARVVASHVRRPASRSALVRMTECWLAIGLSSRIGFGLAREIRLPGRLDEGEVDHLLVVARREPLAQRVQRALRPSGTRAACARRRAADAPRCARSRDARHLLDQVLLDREIEAIARAG